MWLVHFFPEANPDETVEELRAFFGLRLPLKVVRDRCFGLAKTN